MPPNYMFTSRLWNWDLENVAGKGCEYGKTAACRFSGSEAERRYCDSRFWVHIANSSALCSQFKHRTSHHRFGSRRAGEGFGKHKASDGKFTVHVMHACMCVCYLKHNFTNETLGWLAESKGKGSICSNTLTITGSNSCVIQRCRACFQSLFRYA